MAPFITEEIFSLIKEHVHGLKKKLDSIDLFTKEMLLALEAPCCMSSSFPKAIAYDFLANHTEQEFDFIKKLIYTIRNIRGEMKLSPGAKTDLYFQSDQSHLIIEHLQILKSLLPIEQIYFDKICPSSFTSSATVEKTTILIPLPKDLLEKEKERLIKEEQKKTQNLEGLKQKLANPNFIERAPQELVERQKDLIAQTEQELLHIQQKLTQFS